MGTRTRCASLSFQLLTVSTSTLVTRHMCGSNTARRPCWSVHTRHGYGSLYTLRTERNRLCLRCWTKNTAVMALFLQRSHRWRWLLYIVPFLPSNSPFHTGNCLNLLC